MLERAAKEPFIENSVYKESDIYELMASEYLNLGDSAKYLEILNLGAENSHQVNISFPILSMYISVREILKSDGLSRPGHQE